MKKPFIIIYLPQECGIYDGFGKNRKLFIQV
jgi:hypothetical protein